MDFIEEVTPLGYHLKILFGKWQFMVFNKKGQSVYVDDTEGSLLHKIPMIIFLGKHIGIKKNYESNYILAKIRNNQMIIPYIDKMRKKTDYLFVPAKKVFDVIPIILKYSESITSMVKEYDSNTRPDYVIVDSNITPNDIIIIKNRYHVDDVILLQPKEKYENGQEEDKAFNINVMSNNPVFLAKIHLKKMEFTKIKQILFDFELNALDTDYILKFIEDILSDQELYMTPKNRSILENLRDSFLFYMHLLKKSDDEIYKMIQAADSIKKLDTLRTLVSKVKAQHPGQQEQITFNEYENSISDRSETVKNT